MKTPPHSPQLPQTVQEYQWVSQKLMELSQQMEFIIPLERNFSLQAEYKQESWDLTLIHDQTPPLSLGQFLPPWVTFEVGERFAYLTKEKKVIFPLEKLPYRFFLLSLFHEIGHSHQTFKTISRVKRLRYGIEMALRLRKLRAQLEATWQSLDSHSLLEKIPDPDWLILYYSNRSKDQERDAWRYALKQMRQLQQKGFEVFAWFEGKTLINDFLKLCLYSHELGYYLQLLLQNSKNIHKFSPFMKSHEYFRQKYFDILKRDS